MFRLAPWAALALGFSLPAGERWDLQYFYDKNESSLSFIDLQFASASHGIAVGSVQEERRSQPVAAVTSDGGSSWSLVSLKDQPFSLTLLNERLAWMVTVRGRLWSTTDGGRSWKEERLAGVRAEPVRVFFQDASRGWLLCSRMQVYETSDGGRSWKFVPDSVAPDLPETRAIYTLAAKFESTVLLAGFMRPGGRRSRFPVWMEPELAAIGMPPTSSFLLHSTDGGGRWTRHLLPSFGEIKRLRPAGPAAVFALVHHLDSLVKPTEILAIDLSTRKGRSLYADKNRWLTDLILPGEGRLFAAALDQEGRSGHPAIPAKLRLLSSRDGVSWRETEVDYRAEARSAVLASPGAGHAWVATDTGMILRWVKE